MATDDRETVGEDDVGSDPRRPPRPGLILAFGPGGPAARALPLDGGRLIAGRDLLADDKVSREHAEIRFAAGRWTVADLGSRNGTFVDAVQVTGDTPARAPRVIRVGGSLLLPVADLQPYLDRPVAVDRDRVAGPLLLDVFDRAGRAGDVLLIGGESGSGKELAARAFHAAGGDTGAPFIAVNCAAIPDGLAERLLFGARKGAFSGADADVDGYVQAANRGTLFLDEVAELDEAVQAKLLRVLETREVLALGASRPTPVSVRVAAATHKDLRAEVERGAFRADLYFRLDQADVRLPPLRDRREEIAFLVARELDAATPPARAHARLVEACLLRAWPGNVRELLAEIRRAAAEARAAGAALVLPDHLRARAGTPFESSAATPAEEPDDAPDRDALAAALAASRGNVAAAARALGVHRTQLYRWLKRRGLRSDP